MDNCFLPHSQPSGVPFLGFVDFSFEPSLSPPASFLSSSSASFTCPSHESPSPAFYSSPSVCHSSPCIDVTSCPASPSPVSDLEWEESLGDIFTLDDCLASIAGEELRSEFAVLPTQCVDNHDETPSSETIGQRGTLTSYQEDERISWCFLSPASCELDPVSTLPAVCCVPANTPNPLPNSVSACLARTVSVSAPDLRLANLAESLHCPSALFCGATCDLDSPVTSKLTVSASSETYLCERHASDVDSVRDSAHEVDHELQSTALLTIAVETESVNLNDGYVWRKYGEKKIKNKKFRRSYFRCAQTGCTIRKQTERISEKHVAMTYLGKHNHYV